MCPSLSLFCVGVTASCQSKPKVHQREGPWDPCTLATKPACKTGGIGWEAKGLGGDRKGTACHALQPGMCARMRAFP